MRKYILILLMLTSSFCYSLHAQNITISGKVVDDQGITLPGVTIIEAGTTNGTATDEDGIYTIKVKDNKSVLTFTYLGFATQNITVENKTSINVAMSELSIDMEEVVVIGYGVQKKATVVGAIASGDVEGMQKTGTTNLTQSLSGRISGIISRSSGGRPGEDNASVLIRGRASYNSGVSSPLVLVDGVEREYAQIDPEDIESFNVLKDASATAVYGVRGANGVILITTKRGDIGKPQVSLRATFTSQSPINLPKKLGSYDYARLKNEALNNVGQDAEYSSYDLDMYRTKESPYTHPDNDYFEDLLKDATFKQQYNLTVRGGSPFVNYYVSANFLDDDGIYKNFDNGQYNSNVFFKRYGVRTNLDFNLTTTTTFGVDMSGRFEERRDNGGGNIYYWMMRTPPNQFNYINPDGSYGGYLDFVNPYAALTRYGYNHSKRNVFESVLKLRQKLDFVTPGLSARAMFGFVSTMRSRRDLYERPEIWRYEKDGSSHVISQLEDIKILTSDNGPHTRDITTEMGVNYNRKFGNHDVTGLLAFNRLQTHYNANIPGGYMNYVGRATYSYKNKYMAELNAGYNGSMQFSKDKRYGFFPAFSMGWVLSEEKFWDNDSKIFNYLKIRGSYGEVGNDRIGSSKYFYEQIYPMLTSNRPAFGTEANAMNRIYEGTIGSSLVGWERSQKSNIGFDSWFFNNKLSITFDVFHERRKDILDYDRMLTYLYGMLDADDSNKGTPPRNMGEVINKGFDMEISYSGKINRVNYYAKGIATFARNKVNKIGEDALAYPWMTRIGRPIEQRYGLIAEGFYNTREEINALPSRYSNNLKLGDLKYKDVNGDGIIDSYDEVPIGSGTNMPEWDFGLTLGAKWNGFDFEIFFQGAVGGDIYMNGAGYWEFTNSGSVLEHHLGRWTPETMNTATYPSLSPRTSEQNHRLSTFWLKKRDYLRLKNIQLGYTVPANITNKVSIKNLRFYVSATNLHTFSHSNIYDPESDDGDNTKYPLMRQIYGGFSLNF